MNKAAEVPRKVFLVVTPVIAAGVASVFWAAYRYGGQPHTPRQVAEFVDGNGLRDR